MTVGELKSRMSSIEVSQWMAFDRIEPFGEIRADIRQGITSSIMANAWKAKGTKDRKPSDYIVRPKPVQTPMDMLDVVVSINKAVGGKDLRRK